MRDTAMGCCDRHDDGLSALEDVRAEILSLVCPVASETHVPLDRCVGRTVSQGIRATQPLPSCDNSAVDGYALGAPGSANRYRVRARIAAGDAAFADQLARGEAVRIFTGAPIPKGTVTVAMQEHAKREGDLISLGEPAGEARHIRRGGEDVRPGDDLIAAGTTLDPRHVAILAAMGMAEIPVTSPIRVALFSSGKELCDPGQLPGPAAIHDSNRWMLKALMASPMVKIHDLGILPDDRIAIAAALGKAGQTADLILSTGGVSFGEEDHIFAALSEVGSNIKQRRMAVKPGKPLVFGKVGRVLSLGLPGNPVAALVSFQLLAKPVIAALAGGEATELEPIAAVASFDWSRSAGRAEYFPARCIGMAPDGQPLLEKLGQGGSARLRPLIAADGLARVGIDTVTVAQGDRLDWFPFQTGFALC